MDAVISRVQPHRKCVCGAPRNTHTAAGSESRAAPVHSQMRPEAIRKEKTGEGMDEEVIGWPHVHVAAGGQISQKAFCIPTLARRGRTGSWAESSKQAVQ